MQRSSKIYKLIRRSLNDNYYPAYSLTTDHLSGLHCNNSVPLCTCLIGGVLVELVLLDEPVLSHHALYPGPNHTLELQNMRYLFQVGLHLLHL